MEKGATCAVMRIPAAGLELSSTAAAVQHSAICFFVSKHSLLISQPRTLTCSSTGSQQQPRVQATAVDRYFRRLGSVAVRTAVDVCCRRPRFAECQPVAAVLDNSTPAAGIRMATYTTP